MAPLDPVGSRQVWPGRSVRVAAGMVRQGRRVEARLGVAGNGVVW